LRLRLLLLVLLLPGLGSNGSLINFHAAAAAFALASSLRLPSSGLLRA
jgi:hypothetical protein